MLLTTDGFSFILPVPDQIEIHFHFDSYLALIKREEIHMSLLDAAQNRLYRIESLEGPETECRRLLDLGLTPGEEMAVVQSVPFGDPLVVMVRGMRLALRRREAAWIRVQ